MPKRGRPAGHEHFCLTQIKIDSFRWPRVFNVLCVHAATSYSIVLVILLFLWMSQMKIRANFVIYYRLIFIRPIWSHLWIFPFRSAGKNRHIAVYGVVKLVPTIWWRHLWKTHPLQWVIKSMAICVITATIQITHPERWLWPIVGPSWPALLLANAYGLWLVVSVIIASIPGIWIERNEQSEEAASTRFTTSIVCERTIYPRLLLPFKHLILSLKWVTICAATMNEPPPLPPGF